MPIIMSLERDPVADFRELQPEQQLGHNLQKDPEPEPPSYKPLADS